jgi:large subunit ribosomal protein L21
MYAIIRAGGKQHKVSTGDVIEVERLKGSAEEVDFSPLLVVNDDGSVLSSSEELGRASVVARVLGETRGEKLYVQHYRSKTGYRRRTGHRQRYTNLEIADIKVGARKRARTTRKQAEDDGS